MLRGLDENKFNCYEITAYDTETGEIVNDYLLLYATYLEVRLPE